MQKHPLFFWSLYFLIGISFALFFHWVLILPLSLLLFLSKKRVQHLMLCLLGFFYAYASCEKIPEEAIEGEGIFSLREVAPIHSPFQKTLLFKGKLECFERAGKTYLNLPCTFTLSQLPKKGKRWLVKGVYKQGRLKLSKDALFFPIDTSVSLAKFRYDLKVKASKKCYQISKGKVGHFFSTMATGNASNWQLTQEFRKLGLGHILAISGLHFSLAAGVIAIVLRLFFSIKWAYILVLVILTGYLLFLGGAPSIIRAYIMISLYLLGRILNRSVDPLNLMGCALLGELIAHPLSLGHVGFQFSFVATGAILLFFPFFDKIFSHLLGNRTFEEAKALSFFQKHMYLLNTGVRKMLALNMAVYLSTIPLSLFHFSFFPLMSLPYNFIFPPFLSLSLILLPLSFLIPPIAKLNTLYTHFLLHLISHPPEKLNLKLFATDISHEWVIAFLTLIGGLGLTLKAKGSQNSPLYGGRSSAG